MLTDAFAPAIAAIVPLSSMLADALTTTFRAVIRLPAMWALLGDALLDLGHGFELFRRARSPF
jgi:hypothetical protein